MNISIIGAWASGMMVAATLVELGIPWNNIHLFDGNKRIGRKVAITGGGRCNVTTGIIKKQELLPKYIRWSDFIEPSLSKFSPKKVREWFESHGVRLKAEEDLRVFPISDRGEEIIECFEKILKDWGVRLHLGEKINTVGYEDGEYSIITWATTKTPLPPLSGGQSSIPSTKGIISQGEFCPPDKGGAQRAGGFREFRSDILVIATGWNAYAQTGSVGDGYSFARALGHMITPLAPSLASFITAEKWCEDISGLSLQKARFETGKWLRVDGAMLFTHFGISGPGTFALSAHLAFEKMTQSSPFPIKLIPDREVSFDAWEKHLVEDFAANPTKALKNILAEYFPRRFIETILAVTWIDGEKRATHVSRDERRKIVQLFGNGIPLSLTGRRPNDEFVSAGWVSLGEVDPETMESKILRNLYFTGELLDIDAVTGGFNLQGCWATGRACGVAVARG